MSVLARLLNGSSSSTDILVCMYGLNALETRTYLFLAKRTGCRIETVAQALDRDRSTVYRALQTLHEADLVEREAVAMESGGYFYTYQAAPPNQVRELIEQRLAELETAVRDGLEALEAELQAPDEAAGPPAAGPNGGAAPRTP